jgi:hypothetical protein
MLHKRSDTVLILWTSSYEKYVDSVRKKLQDNYGIKFDYFNENPECINTKTGCFDNKFYYNVLIDDKAGFNPESDWLEIINAMENK